jgi:hypothetical protein
MQEVANIEPIGSTPGLVAFLCVDCGLTDSILVYSVNRGGKVNHKQAVEGRTMLKSGSLGTYSLGRGNAIQEFILKNCS